MDILKTAGRFIINRFFRAYLLGLVIYVSAFAQVDTLQLAEIRRIQTPDWINFTFIEEMTGDSIDDFIICTGTHIYIYNGINFEIYWTSPYILCAGEIKFADADGDGLNDIFCRSGQNIYVFNPPETTTYWISPSFGDLYRLFAVGDRNSDGYSDIAMLFEEPFSRPADRYNQDTIWINIYDGPGFSSAAYTFFRLPNCTYCDTIVDSMINCYEHYESPTEMFIENVSGNPGGPIIGVFYSQYAASYFDFLFIQADITGVLRMMRGDNLTPRSTTGVGNVYDYVPFEVGNNRFLLTISDYRRYAMIWEVLENKIFSNIFGYNGRTALDTIASCYGSCTGANLKGIAVADFNSHHSGYEVAYGYENNLTVYGIPEHNRLWQYDQLGNRDSILSVVRVSLYTNPQILIFDHITGIYRLLDGNSGSLRGVFIMPDSPLTPFGDINGDGNFEIVSMRENTVQIFNLQRVFINDEPTMPEGFILFPNYPNPFNAQTIIEYNLPEESNVTFDIYDLLGRKVATLREGLQSAGRHKTIWDAGRSSSGMYFYRLTAGKKSSVKKAILIK
jgi:hypothetical protein